MNQKHECLLAKLVVRVGENSEDIYLQLVYILDSKLNGRVMWDKYDWPIDLFMEDLLTVINQE
jgi:hypothetical protein